MNSEIDFIITWVDSSDPEWIKERNNCVAENSQDDRERRFRDWGLLKYWFRGVENFAPWVNKIHFVTWQHYPDWLNVKHPKLELVKHKDFIPSEFLPTFNSRTIDLNLHHIDGLSEQYVYFNDDMFIIKPTKKSDYFKHGLPCDTGILNALCFTQQEDNRYIYLAPACSTAIINKHFIKNRVIFGNIGKWFNFKYGLKWLRTALLLPWSDFPGFMNYHLPYSYRKETFKELWRLEKDLLSSVCEKKFRQNDDLNSWAFSYWQIASGNFYPRNPNLGKSFDLKASDDVNRACQTIEKQKYKMVCINDNVDVNCFEPFSSAIRVSFENLLPDKSSFEI